MAKGAISKEQVTAKILEVFPGAFQYEKEIRIPMIEDGNEIQIKVALTCAKTNVECGADVAIPGASSVEKSVSTVAVASTSEPVKATEDEKQAVADLMSQFGL